MGTEEKNLYLKYRKMRSVDLPTQEQVLGAVKVTLSLVEDGIISMSRAAELCGIKILEYRVLAKDLHNDAAKGD